MAEPKNTKPRRALCVCSVSELGVLKVRCSLCHCAVLCIAQPETYMQKYQGIQSEGLRRDRQAGRHVSCCIFRIHLPLGCSILFSLLLPPSSPSRVSCLSRMIRRQQAFSAYHCISMFKPRRTPPCQGRLLGCHHAQSLQPLTHVSFCLHRISAAEHKVVSALLGCRFVSFFPNHDHCCHVLFA